MELLDTLADMIKKSTDNPEKLIAVLFNVQYPVRGTIEPSLQWWRHSFEEAHNVIFCKRVCSRDDQQWKADFKITMKLALIFFYKGEEVGSLKNLNETKPDFKPLQQPAQEIPDEKTLKQTIINLCNTHCPKKENPS